MRFSKEKINVNTENESSVTLLASESSFEELEIDDGPKYPEAAALSHNYISSPTLGKSSKKPFVKCYSYSEDNKKNPFSINTPHNRVYSNALPPLVWQIDGDENDIGLHRQVRGVYVTPARETIYSHGYDHGQGYEEEENGEFQEDEDDDEERKTNPKSYTKVQRQEHTSQSFGAKYSHLSVHDQLSFLDSSKRSSAALWLYSLVEPFLSLSLSLSGLILTGYILSQVQVSFILNFLQTRMYIYFS
jgi:hypothetical protein